MPVVPFATPQAQAAAAAPDPTFIAIAGREFVDSARTQIESMSPPRDVAPGWSGAPEDKQRAMNLLRRKSKGEEIEPDASQWLDGYMEWVDRTSQPIKRGK